MSLLDHYLRAVRFYLPSSRDKDDILIELREHLCVKIDEREEELGRALTEPEQEEVLARHGDPETVARRYGGSNLGLAFGRQLISPKVFPIYLRILLFQFGLSILVVFGVGFFVEQPPGIMRYAVPLGGHFIVTTSIFIAIDALQRRSRSMSWSFPPPHLQPVPRWQSAAGLVVLGSLSLWWAGVPYAPRLVFGNGASELELTQGWTMFYLPILLLLLIGTTQRAVTLARPHWNWLQPVVRLLTNGASLALVYPIAQAFPYVLPVPDASIAAVSAAGRINALIWWSVVTGLSFYWLVNAAFMVWLCVQHAGYFWRRRREQAARVQLT